MKRSSSLFAAAVVLAMAAPASAQFTYRPAGELVAGSGRGRADMTVYAPGIRYPVQDAPSYPGSQVWGVGGSQGPSGSSCDRRNFSYPWHDNYCESRSWDMPMCPSGTGHQGQDIRAATCTNSMHPAVAVSDGTITNVGSYSVYLTDAAGVRFDYLHMSNVAVRVGQRVTRGQRMGLVSNQFGGTPTTVHLHFNIRKTVSGFGNVYVSPYMSLVRAYESLLGGTTPTPTAPRFRAEFVMQSFPYARTTLDLPAGSERRGFFEMRNTGSETWRPGEIFFGTTQPRDRTSMARGSDWSSASRPASVDRVVAPGATGRFNFSLRAPTTVGAENNEFFGMLRESVAWFSDTGQGGPADNVMQVRVRAASAAVDAGVVVDSGARDAAVEPEDVVEIDVPVTDADDPPDDLPVLGDGGADDASVEVPADDASAPADGGVNPVREGCGCTTPSRANAPRSTLLLALGLSLAVAMRRRRRR